jgi:hypothetical protein
MEASHDSRVARAERAVHPQLHHQRRGVARCDPSPEFHLHQSDGRRISRADYLKAWATGFDGERIPYYDYRDEVINVVGNTALVRSTNKRVGLKDGVETVAMTMHTDIYVHENGAWKCLQAQITPVAPANYPSDDTVVRKYVKGQAQ